MPKPKPPRPTRREAIAGLTEAFHRNGYIRRQNLPLREIVGSRIYKKGNEVRLTAHSEEELARLQAWLTVLRFTFGKPFPKDSHFRLPIYGREQIKAFLALVGYPLD